LRTTEALAFLFLLDQQFLPHYRQVLPGIGCQPDLVTLDPNDGDLDQFSGGQFATMARRSGG
jgi:hypothetical protein